MLVPFPPAPDAESLGRPLQVGFLCPHNPFDRQSFSGTAFHTARALGEVHGIRLRILGDHRPPGPFAGPLDRILRRPPRTVKAASISLAGLDAVVGLVATRLVGLLLGQPDVPYIHVTDATPAFLRDVYGWDLPPDAAQAERQAAERADVLLYSSQYMADRAARELPGAKGKARSVPFGINLEDIPARRPDRPAPNPPQMLFVCSDWQRKGGDMAIETLVRLRHEGVPARLTIVGRMPESLTGTPGVTWAGYLDKTKARHARRLAELYSEAHLLLLPTRADCTPMVVAEAMAHGIPVLATDVGGMPTLVDAPATGRLLPPAATAGDWAAAVRDLTSNPEVWARASVNTFARCHRELSWPGWASAVRYHLDGAIRRHAQLTAA